MAKARRHDSIDGKIVETVGDVPAMMARIVAVALSQQVPGFEGIKIGRTYTVVYLTGDKAARYRTPQAFVDQIEGFKTTGEFDLGGYTLEVVGDAFEDE